MMIREISILKDLFEEQKHLIAMIGQQFIDAACIANSKEIFLLKFVSRNHRLL